MTVRRLRAPWVESASTVAVVLAAWELTARILSSPALPTLTSVLATFAGTLVDGAALRHLRSTVWKVVASFAAGSAIGVLGGLLVGWIRIAESFFKPLVYFTYSLPRVALIPLFIIWVGLGARTVVAAATVAVFYLVFVNTLEGVKQVNPLLPRAAASLSASNLQIARTVLLPGSATAIFSALRLGIGQALVSVVAGEILVGQSGFGYWIWHARFNQAVTLVFVNLIWLALLGWLLTELSGRIERRLVSRRSGSAPELPGARYG